MNPPRSSDAPFRYREIETYLRGLIERGSAGDVLPTEAELCERFGVSRMTVRQALQQLADGGLIDRRRGRGTFVAAPPVHRRPGVFLSFTEEMTRRGSLPSSLLVRAGVSPARDDERRELSLADRADVVRIERIRLADGVPIAFEDAALLLDHAAVLSADLRTGSLHQALGQLGVVATSATGSVRARLATRQEARQLEAASPVALLVETRLLFDQTGRPFELTESRYVADRYVIDVVHTHP